jgi:hypothetical protein
VFYHANELTTTQGMRISARMIKGCEMLTECDLIPEADFAAQIDQSVHTLRTWRSRGLGPPFVKIGKKVFYSKGARLWVLAQERNPAEVRKPRAKRRRAV